MNELNLPEGTIGQAGAGQPSPASLSIPQQERLRRIRVDLADVDRIRKEVAAELREQVRFLLNDAQLSHAKAVAELRGCVGTECDQAEATVRKIVADLRKKVQGYTADAFDAMRMAGGLPPSTMTEIDQELNDPDSGLMMVYRLAPNLIPPDTRQEQAPLGYVAPAAIAPDPGAANPCPPGWMLVNGQCQRITQELCDSLPRGTEQWLTCFMGLEHRTCDPDQENCDTDGLPPPPPPPPPPYPPDCDPENRDGYKFLNDCGGSGNDAIAMCARQRFLCSSLASRPPVGDPYFDANGFLPEDWFECQRVDTLRQDKCGVPPPPPPPPPPYCPKPPTCPEPVPCPRPVATPVPPYCQPSCPPGYSPVPPPYPYPVPWPIPPVPPGTSPPPGVPPEPPKPPVGPIAAPPGRVQEPSSLFDWDNPRVCERIGREVDPSKPLMTDEQIRETWEAIMKPIRDYPVETGYGIVADGMLKAFRDGITEVVGIGGASVTTNCRNILQLFRELGMPLAPVTSFALVSLALPAFVAEWTGIPLDYCFTPFQHMMQWSMPVHLPEQTGIDDLYLFNVISDDDWTCWTRAHGNLPESHRKVRDLKSTRLNVPEVIDLYMRREIDHDTMTKWLRERGVTDGVNTSAWLKLRTQLPPFTDIIRMMVRDAVNMDNVAADGLHEGFEAAFTGQLRDWAAMQGISEELAKVYWAAHWQEISPTQGYNMLHRLRPGKVPDDLVVTEERLDRMLREADYPPRMVPKLVAISYLPINRTDLLTGVKAGVVDRVELIDRLQDLGYSHKRPLDGGKTDAERLADIMVSQAKRQVITTAGQWTLRKISVSYQAGELTEIEAKVLAAQFLDDPDQIQALIDNAQQLMEATRRRRCIAGVRRRFLVGEFTADVADTQLMVIGVDLVQRDLILGGWKCELQTRRKEPTVKMLLEWVHEHIITIEALYQRLLNLGYSDHDAANIVNANLAKWQRQAEADAIREAKRLAEKAEADARRERAEKIKEAKKKRQAQSS